LTLWNALFIGVSFSGFQKSKNFEQKREKSHETFLMLLQKAKRGGKIYLWSNLLKLLLNVEM